MKICPVCQAQLADEVTVCPRCGTDFGAADAAAQQPVPPAEPAEPARPVPPAPQPPMPQATPQPGYYVPPYAVYVDPTDHTAEFDPADIADNKLFAMLCYLLGAIGVVIAALCAKESPYVHFHVRQALKITVCTVLLLLIGGVLVFTVIVPIAAAVCLLILEVVTIISFFDVCRNKAKEAAIVKSFGFLK